ncbi:MAG: hypothetical protein PHT43_05060 [Anaerolineaceae bacterium]|jgi:hypothetical protein|nr:hypothetical protein [Anaerolineaceae bacterium]
MEFDFEQMQPDFAGDNFFESVRTVSLKEISPTPIVHRDKVRDTERRKLKLLSRRHTAHDFVGEITPGFYITGFTMGQFSLIDVVAAVVKQLGPLHVVMSTWTVARADCTELLDMLNDGSFKSFRLLIDTTFQKRQPAITDTIRKQFGASSITVTRNHAKLLLLSNAQYKIYGETSMNLNFNPRMETVSLRDDPELFDFFQGAINQIFKHHGDQEGEDYRRALRQFSDFKFTERG